MSQSLPLLFACSGCSHAGRLAYDVAQELDLRGIAEMSCLAGVGALKPNFLKQLRNRETWVIDGCPIHCAQGVLQQVQQPADVHIKLHDLGVRKSGQPTPDCDIERLIDGAMKQVATQRPAAPTEGHGDRESPATKRPHFALLVPESALANRGESQ